MRYLVVIALLACACGADDVNGTPSNPTHFLQAEAYGIHQGQTATDLAVSVAWEDGTKPTTTWTQAFLIGMRQHFASADAARQWSAKAVYRWKDMAVGTADVSLDLCEFVSELGFSPDAFKGVIVGREFQFSGSGSPPMITGAKITEPEHLAGAVGLRCRQSLPSTIDRLPEGFELVYTFISASKNMIFSVDGKVVTPAAIGRGTSRYFYEVRLAYPTNTDRAGIGGTLQVSVDGKPLTDIEIGFRKCDATGVVEEFDYVVDGDSARLDTLTCLHTTGLITSETS